MVKVIDHHGGFGVLGGLGDGESGGGLEGVGELAVALEGLVLGPEVGVELVFALVPELVVDGQLGGALAEGGHVLVVRCVGGVAVARLTATKSIC